jgi:hypothetical protein
VQRTGGTGGIEMGFEIYNDDDVYLDILKTRGVKISILYM